MRHYIPYVMLVWILDIDQSKLSKYINFCIKLLYNALQKEIYIPSRLERIEQLDWFVDNINNRLVPISMCVDGSEQEIRKASDRAIEEFHYSGKV